jgi:hypothetical protein
MTRLADGRAGYARALLSPARGISRAQRRARVSIAAHSHKPSSKPSDNGQACDADGHG